MISSKLKYYFLQRKVKKLQKSEQLSTTVAKNKKIVSVGILTEEKFREKFDLRQMTAEMFHIKNPKIYSFRAYNKELEKSFKHFSEKDFNWKGEITETSFQSFLNEPFDLLICYFSEGNIMLKYAAQVSNATFKVGFTSINTNLFDLNIAVKLEEVDQFFFESRKYLTILGKLV